MVPLMYVRIVLGTPSANLAQFGRALPLRGRGVGSNPTVRYNALRILRVVGQGIITMVSIVTSSHLDESSCGGTRCMRLTITNALMAEWQTRRLERAVRSNPRAGSNPAGRTITIIHVIVVYLLSWWNGRHAVLRRRCPYAGIRVQISAGAPLSHFGLVQWFSTPGSDPGDVGSNPTTEAIMDR